jgi:hypothetical protein
VRTWGTRLIGLGGSGGAKGRFDFMPETAIYLSGVDPEGRPAFYFQLLRGGVVVPLDRYSVFYCFPFRTDDADPELRSFPPQAGKKFAGDSVEDLLGIP